MQLSLLPVSLLLSLATAQQTTLTFSAGPSSSTACAGKPVLDACVASTSAIVASCGPTDWGCLCGRWTDVVTCYTASGCPNDVGLSTAQNSRDTYCAQASIYTTSTSSAISRDVPTATTTNGPAAPGTGTGTPAQNTPGGNSNGNVRVGGTPTGPAGSAEPTQSGSGAGREVAFSAGSTVLGLAVLVGALL